MLGNKNKDEFFLILVSLSLFFVFNPLYVLLFLVILERWIRLPRVVNNIFACAFSLMFINREIGNSWTSGDVYAADDVLNYLEFYRHVFDLEFLKGLGLSLYGGGEPLWFFIAGLVNVVTNSNEFSLVVVSVLVPVMLLQRVFYSISRDFFFNTAFFIIFYPEINHVFYHLWRYSLSLVLVLTVLSVYLISTRISIKYYTTSLLAHVSSTFILSFFLYAAFFRSPIALSVRKRIVFIFSLFLFFLVFCCLVYFILDYIEYEKFIFYLKSEEVVTPFSYNNRHYLYMMISFAILVFSRNKISILFSLLGVILLTIPFWYSVSLIYERVLLLVVPTVIVVFLFEIKYYSRLKLLLLVPLFLVAISFWLSVEGKLFYEFMSNGHNFNIFNGMVYNLNDLLYKDFLL